MILQLAPKLTCTRLSRHVAGQGPGAARADWLQGAQGVLGLGLEVQAMEHGPGPCQPLAAQQIRRAVQQRLRLLLHSPLLLLILTVLQVSIRVCRPAVSALVVVPGAGWRGMVLPQCAQHTSMCTAVSIRELAHAEQKGF